MMRRMTLLALTGLLSLPVVSLGAQTQLGTEQEDEALNGSSDAGQFSAGEMDQQMQPQAKIRDPFEPRSFSVTPETEADEGEHGRIERIMGRSMEDERRDTGAQGSFRQSESMPGEQPSGEMRREGAAGDTGAQGSFQGSSQGSFRGSEDMKREQDRSFRESDEMKRDQEQGAFSRPPERRGLEGEPSGDVGAQGSFRNETREEGKDARSGAAGTTGTMEGAEGTHGGTQSTPGTTQRSPGASGSFGGSAGGSMGGSMGGAAGGR